MSLTGKSRDFKLGGADRGSVVVSWYAPSVIEVEWNGHVTGETITEALVKARDLQGNHPVTHVIANTTHVVGYTVNVRTPSLNFMEHFRGAGAKEFVGVIPNIAVRMFAASMALVTRVKFSVFASRMEAVAYLEKSRG